MHAKTGKQYWRSLEELAEDPHFVELLQREFPRQAPSEWDEGVDRRDFLKLMAASLAFAGLSGCGIPPRENVVPYVKQPEGLVLGKPLFFATVMPFGADAIGVLVESHEGRPTKIEGNPDHPASLGGTNAFAQASILDLYDPDRAQITRNIGDIRSWSQFVDSAQAEAATIKSTNGANFRILTGTITSSLVLYQIQALLKLYPQAKWHQWEPAVSDAPYGTRRRQAGVRALFEYRISRGKSGRDFVVGRRLSGQRSGQRAVHEGLLSPPEIERSRRWHEPAVRGGTDADRNRLDCGSSFAASRLRCGTFCASAGREIRVGRWRNISERREMARCSGRRPAKTPRRFSGGGRRAAKCGSACAAAHAINATLGNAGVTVFQTEPVEAQPVNHLQSITDLCADMDAGKVDTLLILGVNPIYTAPHDFDFVSKIKKVRNSVHVSSHFDETSAYTQWHVPESHYLETWGDARAFDGTLSVIQPLIAPLYASHSAREVLAAFSDKPGVSDYDALREKLKAANPGADFEKFWRKTLNDGVVANSAFAPVADAAKFSLASLPPAKANTPVRTNWNLFSDPIHRFMTGDSPTTAGCRNCRSR